MKLTQREKIANALKRGETLTMLSGLRFGTLNLHKRLDETGLPVERVWVKRAGRKLRGWRLAA
jgi:hypothetical protein